MKKSAVSPQEALLQLKEGNARFISASTTGPNRTAERRAVTAHHGQEPFATIVSCADSRVPLLVIFDQGIGDIFALQVAGNICSPEVIGSIEYAVLHLGTPLVVMLGHSKCGAITAVVQEHVVDGHLMSLVQQISPAVERARAAHPNLTEADLINEAIHENMWLQIETLLGRSQRVSAAVKAGQLDVVAAHYDIEHGEVTWYGNHPKQSALLK
jgi:carbonic anhydrase